jgi:hypothetical protein
VGSFLLLASCVLQFIKVTAPLVSDVAVTLPTSAVKVVNADVLKYAAGARSLQHLWVGAGEIQPINLPHDG